MEKEKLSELYDGLAFFEETATEVISTLSSSQNWGLKLLRQRLTTDLRNLHCIKEDLVDGNFYHGSLFYICVFLKKYDLLFSEDPAYSQLLSALYPLIVDELGSDQNKWPKEYQLNQK